MPRAGFTVLDSQGRVKTVTSTTVPDTVVTTTATGAQADFAPGLSGHTFLRCNNATDLTIAGFASGVNGQRLTIVSVGAGKVFLTHNGVNAIASSKLLNAVTSVATPLAAGSGRAVYEFDSTSAGWRLISHIQGAPIAVTYASGNFLVFSGGGTWTVDSGDQITFQYTIIDKMCLVQVILDTTSISGTCTRLQIITPVTSVARVDGVGTLYNNSASVGQAIEVFISAASPSLLFNLYGSGALTASTNLTYVRLALMFEAS